MTMAWPEARLGDVAKIERSSIAPGAITSGTIYVGLENMTADGRFDGHGPVQAGELASQKYRFSSEHVLYGKLRPYLSKIAIPSFSGVCSTDILPIRPGTKLDKRFLFHFLRHPSQVAKAASLATGANLPRLSPKVFAEVSVPLPPIEEQRRITALLDAADALRAKRRQALAKLDTLTQAVFVDMFVGMGSTGWETVRVKSIAADRKGAIRTGPFGSQLLHTEFVDEGVAVLGIDNAVQNRFTWDRRRFITERKYAQLHRFRVFPGDVLVTIMGTCGRVAIVPDDIPLAINTKHLCCITPDQDRCLPDFLWACLRFHPRVLRQLGATHGAVMPGLNMARIQEAEIDLPPIDLQSRFSECKATIERSLNLYRESLRQLNSLFASIQQRAFRGEL